MAHLSMIPALLLIAGVVAQPPAPGVDAPAPPGTDPELVPLLEHAARLRPLIETDAVRAWIDEVASLEPIEPRTIYYRTGEDAAAYTSEEVEGLTEEQREGLRAMDVTTSRFYATFYGSPLAYVRALDLAASAGIPSWDGTRVCDLGYGSITQLRLLAACGADAVGIEIQPVLRAMYSYPGDQGEVTGTTGATGAVDLVHGFWPAGEGVAEQVGSSFDLFLSRNTLKRGYVNPVFPVPDRHRVTLGVEDDAFLRSIHDALKPGGLAMIYNIGLGEAGEGEDYVAMRDIHDPFPPEAWEAAGFELVAYDVDDSEAARAVGRGLDWDEGERAMDLDELFGRYTIARRAD